MARKQHPFAEAKELTAGWYAVARRVCMSSGPWATEREAQAVADAWNDATNTDARKSV